MPVLWQSAEWRGRLSLPRVQAGQPESISGKGGQMTQAEAIALVKELRRYSQRLDDLCEQVSEALEHPGTNEVMAWQGGVVESSLSVARTAIGHAISAIEATHGLSDDATPIEELGN